MSQLVGGRRRNRKHLVRRGVEPEGIHAETLAWWRAAFAARLRRISAERPGSPYEHRATVEAMPLRKERRKARRH